MGDARAVVIPFGVPPSGRGLGLGLAALLHAFARVDGGSVALAQLHSRKDTQPTGDTAPQSAPVEAFVPPRAWREMEGAEGAPAGARTIITGTFEPPEDGAGSLHVLVYDARTGESRASHEAPFDDDDDAGSLLVALLEEAWAKLGGEIGSLKDLRELSWEALSSVLLAERCALVDPLRGGPHDPFAALMHLGRAVDEAPLARYPSARLSALAIELAGHGSGVRVLDAALRALERAAEDAPSHLELHEAWGALLVQRGRLREAEARLNEAIARDPKRPRPYVILAEALRAQKNIDGALATLQAGVGEMGPDPMLLTECGVTLAQRGDVEGATQTWLGVLEARGAYLPAFAHLSSLAMQRQDVALAQKLVDTALAHPGAHVDIKRRAIQLALMTEPDGVARASRVEKLARPLVESVPEDVVADLVLSRALVTLGDREGGLARLTHVAALAPESAAAAEAQRDRLSLEVPEAADELDAIVRDAWDADPDALETFAIRARRLAAAHPVWHAHFAAGVCEQRLGHWVEARGDLEAAVRLAEGAVPAQVELSRVLSVLGEHARAVSHAEHALRLDAESVPALSALGRALLGLGRRHEAEAAARRALALEPTHEDAHEILRVLEDVRPERSGWVSSLSRVWSKLKR